MSNYKRNNKWHCVKSGEVRLPLLLTLPHSLTHLITDPYNKVVSPQIIQEEVATKNDSNKKMLNKCHGDINLDEVLEVKDKACSLRLRWRTTFTITPPNNNIKRSNTGKLNGYLRIKSTAMLLCLTERWTLSRRIRPEIIGTVCWLALFFSQATQ